MYKRRERSAHFDYQIRTTFAFLCSFIPDIYLIVFCRFMVGFFIYGTITQAFVLISEIVGNAERHFACLVMFGFATIGILLLDLEAYLLQNWRIVNIISTVPCFFILLFYKIIPESIQWLQANGRDEEVVQVLRRIGKWNKKPLPDDFIFQPQDTQANKKASVTDLFRDRKLAVASLQQGYLWLVIAMAYYGIYMASADLGGDFYANMVFLNLVDIPALLTTIYLMDKIGRKWPVLGSMLIGGIFCIGVGIAPPSEKIARVVLGNIGKCFICVAFDGIYNWSVELYPTEVRSAAMGFLAVAGRIGSTSAPWIAQGLKPIATWLPFVMLGAPSVVAFFVSFSLRETKMKKNLVKDSNGSMNLGEPNNQYDNVERGV